MKAGTSVLVGPLIVDVGFPADEVFEAMEVLAGSGTPMADADRAASVLEDAPEGSAESVREYATPIRLFPGVHFTAKTREAVRSIPPNEIQFRHLGGPIRGHVERIVVEPIDEWRSRVTYRGALPPSGRLLRLIHRTVARPAIERVVRSHLGTLEDRIRAERDEGVTSETPAHSEQGDPAPEQA